MREQVIASLPLILLLALLAWGIVLTRAMSKFKRPQEAFWPFAENPGLALQLADSPEFLTKVIGEADDVANRQVIQRVQKLDFVFIVFYVLFFSSVPWARGWSRGWIVIFGLAFLTAIVDGLENRQILRMLRHVPGSSAKRFGQMKWLLYFVTLGAEGGLFFFEQGRSSFRGVLGYAIGVVLILIAGGGIIFSAMASFDGIKSSTKLSALGLLALALSPLIAVYPYPLRVTAEYVAVLRVPLLIGSILFALPFIAFFTSARTLLRNLFDLTPRSLFVVTISALAVSGTVCTTASLILSNAFARFKGLIDYPFTAQPGVTGWLIIMFVVGAPIIGFSLWFSAKQKRGVGRLIVAALSGTAFLIFAGYILIRYGPKYAELIPFLSDPDVKAHLLSTGLFSGYLQDSTRHGWSDHLFAAAAFGCTFVLYVLVGFYGWKTLGKSRTVPALCSALMLLLMLGWMLPALTFFFDAWRIPTLLIIAAVGLLTAQSHHSDHFYDLRERIGAAPDAVKTITASHQSRVIVVAANGGGIQAAAWAAQVLFGLHEEFSNRFEKSLRMISSVSGGSVGNGFFVHWLANRDKDDQRRDVVRRPHDAAAMSSLDEVAWGLAWPDFLRALVPWVFGRFIDRGRALERAWLLNSAVDSQQIGKLDDVISGWNEKVAKGEIPAVVMNATIAETGERLLFATTRLRGRMNGGALLDATELHTINGKQLDVGVVTAARLSATFPYVTPAARSVGPKPQAHIVDGGYYDNYGMATLVEWLDEALEKAGDEIKSVLVIQIHGAPVESDFSDEREPMNRGWFYQAFVPLKTLLSVRSAGQLAHNDLELKLMQQKWSAAGVPIHAVKFKFKTAAAPLSWHLTPQEVDSIRSAWRDGMDDCKQRVRDFLEGNDNLECGCTNCESVAIESRNGSVVVDADAARV